MKLATKPYNKIASGGKVIESRLFDEKRQQISIGDTIEFSENDKPENVVHVTVTDLFRYKTFKELFADHEPALFGEESRDFLLSQIKQFYSVEDELKYGVVGIRLQVER
ncbi:MAG: ASCH domain-containing protein [Candidatus Kaiserbacteria bacterium]|nr:ASCH domain-containing protein [Candidatus Kaiserbacteria bacterium]